MRVKLLLGSEHQLLDLLDREHHTSQADPFESRFATVRHLGLVDQADRLQHVCNVIQPADLCLKKLLVEDFAI